MEKEFVYLFTNGKYTCQLHSFYNYIYASEDQKCGVCNGAGPRRFGWCIPDCFWGLCITESADNHDWQYEFGKTIEDKRQADRTFRNNMLRQAEALRIYERLASPRLWVMLKWLEYKHQMRLNMIDEYYKAVDCFGGPAFFDKTGVGFDWKELGDDTRSV